MAKSPAVLDRSGRRVRLRGESFALTGCIVDGNGNEHHYRLEPNKWCKVDDVVFETLSRKFQEVPEVEVPDWDPDTNQRHNRMEPVRSSYIMEFDDK